MLDTLIQWDCLEVLRTFEDNCIDLTVTSPPYDNLRTYNWFSWDFEWIASELYRVTKDWGVVVWVVGDQTIKGSESGTGFKQALYFKEIGFNLHDTMIFEKSGIPFPSSVRYNQSFEYMFVLSKWKPKTINLIRDKKNVMAGESRNTAKYRTKDWHTKACSWTIAEYGIRNNIWRYKTANSSSTDKIAYQHPAIFPEQLAEDHILSWSNEWDTVLDPFAGSGTTLKMAKKNNRNYVGIEISEEYCNIIRKRLTT